MHRSKLTRLTLTLLIGLMTTSLVACQSNQQVMKLPVKPHISASTINNQMCMDLRDASSLGLYILELERGYH
ncbi:hypothetical protein VL73_49 [Erwinia phage VL73]